MKSCNNCEHYVYDRQSGFCLCTQNENGNGYIRDAEHHTCNKYKGKWETTGSGIKEYSGIKIHDFSIEDLSVIALMLREKHIEPDDLKRMVDDGGYCYKKWLEIWQAETKKAMERFWKGEKE